MVVLIIVSLVRLKKAKWQKQKKNIYDKRNTFSLQQKEAVLVAFNFFNILK